VEGNAINFPGNLRFWSNASFMCLATTKEMDDREDLLSHHALVVTEHGPLGLRSVEELKDLLSHHLDWHGCVAKSDVSIQALIDLV
jgi:hypothetical protein